MKEKSIIFALVGAGIALLSGAVTLAVRTRRAKLYIPKAPKSLPPPQLSAKPEDTNGETS